MGKQALWKKICSDCFSFFSPEPFGWEYSSIYIVFLVSHAADRIT